VSAVRQNDAWLGRDASSRAGMRTGDRARLPMPRTPAPGPLDIALSLILHRALPFASGKRHAAVRARLGLGQDPPISQRAAGARIGLSHQRMAMLEHQVLDVLAATGPPLSMLRALDVLAEVAPCDSATAALALWCERTTEEIIHPAGLLVAADAAGLQPAVELVELAGRRTALVPAGSAAQRAAFIALARRRLAEVGVVRLSRLLQGVGPLSDLEVDVARDQVRGGERVVRNGDVLWWGDDTSSAIVRPLQRMLAGCGSLTADSLAAGIAQHWRYRKPDDVPDREALDVYLAGQPAYRRMAGGRWSLRSPETADELLLPEDRAGIGVIRTSPTGHVARRQLVEAMVAAGYSGKGLPLLIGTSPLLVRVGYGWYGLRRDI